MSESITIAPQTNQVPKTEAVLKTTTFGVTEMTCASCVRRIEKALSKTAVVQEVSVNLATEKAQVVYDADQTNSEQLHHAVERAGYSVRKLPALPAASTTALPVPESATAGETWLPIEGMTCAS